jgi:hypothetical protein
LSLLQDAAYALLLLAAYALFQSRRKRSLWPLAVFTAAGFGGMLVAGPRIITVMEDFHQLFRTSSPTATHPAQILRMLNDGIFGRYWEEAWAVMGNVGYNFHEGLQTYSSTVAAGVVLMCVLLLDTKRHRTGIAAILAALVLVAWSLQPMLGLAGLVCALILIGVESRTPDRAGIRVKEDSELAFHLVTLAACLAMVLVPAFRSLVHVAFFNIDFLHSRITLVALLPLAAVTTIILSGIVPVQQERRHCLPALVWACAIAAAVVALHFAILHWETGLAVDERRIPYQRHALSTAIVIRTIALLVFVGAAIVVLRGKSTTVARRSVVFASLAVVIILECTLYARDRLMGEHTRSYPRAFWSGNYYTSPADTFGVPDQTCLSILAEHLKNEQYRSVILGHDKFHSLTAPFLGQFWNVRLLDGYPTLPTRLAALPWPTGVTNLRSLEFRYFEFIPWSLLALLNVRNVIVVNEAFFYNVPAQESERVCPGLTGLTVLTNPQPVVPRHYFAARAIPAEAVAGLHPIESFMAARLPEGRVELTWWAQTVRGDIEIQGRPKGDGQFHTLARYSPLGNKHHVLKASSAGPYEFRARKMSGREVVFETPIVQAVSDAPPEGERCRLGREAACTAPEKLFTKSFPVDPLHQVLVEGIASPAEYSVEGDIRARYAADYVSFDFEPSAKPRFLVVNELYHPRWQARVDGIEHRVRPTNAVMRGIEIPAGASRLELRFQPFLSSPAAWLMLISGVMALAGFLTSGQRAVRWVSRWPLTSDGTRS